MTVETFIRHFRARRRRSLACPGDAGVRHVGAGHRPAPGGAIVVVDGCSAAILMPGARLIDNEVNGVEFHAGLVGHAARRSSLRSGRRRRLVRPDLAACRCKRAHGLGVGWSHHRTAVHRTIFEVQDAGQSATGLACSYGVLFPLNNACRVVADKGTTAPIGWPVSCGCPVANRPGYRGRPELPAERFVEHDGRILVSHRLACYCDNLEFAGRADHRQDRVPRRTRRDRSRAAALARARGGGHRVLAGSDVLAAAVCTTMPARPRESIRQQLADLRPRT